MNWDTQVVTVPQADLTSLGGGVYKLDVDTFRLALKDLEDSEVGMAFPATHRHNTEVTLSGVTYARTVEMINGYTVSFENTGTPYMVSCVGANHNLGDVTNFDGGVSLLIGNSAGLIVKTVGSGVTAQDKLDIAQATWERALESGLTAEELVRIMTAALSGRSTGTGTTSEQYKSVDGVTTRINATFDANGNRDSVVLNGG